MYFGSVYAEIPISISFLARARQNWSKLGKSYGFLVNPYLSYISRDWAGGQIWREICKMLYLGAQEELEAHLEHASMYFEPYKSFGVEIKSIANS